MLLSTKSISQNAEKIKIKFYDTEATFIRALSQRLKNENQI